MKKKNFAENYFPFNSLFNLIFLAYLLTLFVRKVLLSQALATTELNYKTWNADNNLSAERAC